MISSSGVCSRATYPRLILDARVPIFKMFHPSSNTACTHAHTSISTLKSLVNFCSRDFLFHKKFDESTLAKRHIVVGHFVRSDTGHVMQAIDVTRHSRITQQLVPSTTVLSFVCCSQFACRKNLFVTFGTTLVIVMIFHFFIMPCVSQKEMVKVAGFEPTIFQLWVRKLSATKNFLRHTNIR